MTTRLSGDRRWLVSLAALLLVATSSCSSPAGGPAPTAGAGGPEPSVAASSSAASASPAASETDVDDAGAQSLAITGDWLSAGDKGVWLSGETAIYRLNPATGATVATVPVPQGPCEASATGLGALWTATCTKPGLARIDPATNKVSAHRKLAVPADLDGEARSALKSLSDLSPESGPAIAEAQVSLDQFKAITAKIVELSRRNTNVVALDLSLRKKPELAAACDERIRALQEALANEGTSPSKGSH
jgi:hypothetical protein